ncbi:PilW family protein [Massilia antarctica]|uniref:PilW family protein n=1 Tax=Massilia antarctica TaxID=2765360 RepID=UPI0006BB8718|nr:PilW family protein [Massilia sp. H27-R4]MCY0913982.1 PilW family protein [Massilia sp. H27-R4]CUI04278.1 Type IV fimbrial biogenesis protein PilW [Janthinobacterium sp. CG23_2]CUU28064.1 Type IV fimbrial biogenesis protein PilW [Janthinobacterium sp. CG23_2]
MNPHAAARRGWRQTGLTLVELLVALLLGLLVSLAAASVLVSAQTGYLAQGELAQVDEAGRFALDMMERAARQGAFVDLDREDAPPSPASVAARIGGLDDHVLGGGAGIDSARAGGINGSDVLALRFDGVGEGAEGDGSMLGCAGFGVGAGGEGWSIFYVAQAAGGEAELRCKYRGQKNWRSDALVAGVDTFQVLYGLDTDAPADGLPNQYLSAGAINALDAALALDGASPAEREQDLRRKTHWKRVASIKVALLLHGARRGIPEREPQAFDLFGAGYGGAADPGTRPDEARMPPSLRWRERRSFAATIVLRNAAL